MPWVSTARGIVGTTLLRQYRLDGRWRVYVRYTTAPGYTFLRARWADAVPSSRARKLKEHGSLPIGDAMATTTQEARYYVRRDPSGACYVIDCDRRHHHEDHRPGSLPGSDEAGLTRRTP